ncbi:peptide/nickel transport system substrate-binding protein [Pullulanibacillus pueri]|uniref:ABC transporter substrate-binding protein n=1 Tax=Pullulanibacillus pueri TaxID=1437324 RepID=A0A8J3ELV7_9BACL|nr:ABC transporter substrate-binding protein [Pullulanibacillus pueri]MBM7682637.1 peptide/nickel transport system substrate-binding protein [Pullulanibacillus pueri]GGH82605.1 ABC transporter substrate-binding protein [Pullulanibacillus pueri]
MRFKKGLLRGSLIAAGTMLLLTACSPDSSSTNGKASGDKKASGTITYAGGWATNGVTNPFGSNNIIQNDLSYVPLAWYKYTEDFDYWKVLADSWEMSDDGKTFTVKINPKAKWSDGSALTANDVYVTFELQCLTGAAEGWGLSKINVVDDHTVQFQRDPKTLYSKVMFERQILNNVAILPGKIYEKYIPDNLWTLVKDWGGDKESQATKDATAKLTEYAKKAQSVNLNPKDLIFDGPWELVRTSSSQQLYQKNPNYLYADNVNAGKVVAINQTTNDVTWRALKNGELDYAGVGYSKVVYDQVMKVHKNSYIAAPMSQGMALYFNENISPFDNVKVRQALAYAIDRTAAQKIGEPIGALESGKINGLYKTVAEQWLSKDQLDSLEAYDPNPDKVTELLKSAGFNKTDKGWMVPNGKPFKFNVTVPNLSDWVAGIDAITNQLRKQGIQAQTSVVDTTTWTQEVPLGKYSIYANWDGGSDINPSQAFNQLYITDNNYSVTPSGKLKNTATSPDQRQEAIPETINVPSLGKVKPMELTLQLLGDLSQEEKKGLVYKLAKTTNYYMPFIPIWWQAAGRTISTQRWEWPDITNKPELENQYTYHTPFVVFQTLGLMKQK